MTVLAGATAFAGPMTVSVGPLSTWSLAVIVGWVVVVVLVWLLFFAYGRQERRTPRP